MGFFQKKKPNRSDRRSKQFNNKSSDHSNRHQSEHSNMYPAVCGECGRDCEVPFRPSGKQPVLCFECFRQKDGGAPRRDARNSSTSNTSTSHSSSDNVEIKKQLRTLNEKMDEILEALLESE